MKLYKVKLLIDGPPPEFGYTMFYFVLAENEANATLQTGAASGDVAAVEEIPLDRPGIIHSYQV